MITASRILVVQASAPHLAGSPDAGAEFREIRLSIAGGQYKDFLDLDCLQAARLEDLSDELLREVPAVLHFAARGTPGGGLRFLTDGGDVPVRDQGLSKLVCEFVEEGLQLVVLNACWTSELAELLVSAVPCVIGTAGPIEDQDCRMYSRTLYRALAQGRSIGKSHRIASALAHASGADPDCLPSLAASPGTIPDALHLIGPEVRIPPVRDAVKPRGGGRAWLGIGRKPRL
ncbi:CHAT domain-containing protein [Streptomyces sp. NPDC002120]|uniref:CHAT domain-containing protein n=1 Tax=Streptomyces sp. NPDC002120 TaxID=3364631 RepID=UPI003693F0D6